MTSENGVALRRVVPCGFVRVVSDCFVGVMTGDVMVIRFDPNQVSMPRSG
jgi:hypothetical protein